MSSMDYCYWQGQRCRYSPEHKYCAFHRAFVAQDPNAMLEALADGPPMPIGITFAKSEPQPDGSVLVTARIEPDTP